ncbi:MAG: AAA family ATPase [Gammaproteobacteria bacterium]|nr:AAA family ATPase [Gammaproteobacteria bacterium]
MKITAFNCKAYKAFREETRINLRPLTLIFGKNNSGKSTLLRLPRLLLRSLSTHARNGFPLKIDELSFAKSFRELTYGGLAHGTASFGIRLEDEEECLDLQATVQNGFLRNELSKEFNVVSHLDIAQPRQLKLVWKPEVEMIAKYNDDQEKIPFRGLLPEVHRNHGKFHEWRFVEDWRERIQAFEEQVSHLGPVRNDMPRVFESGAVRALGFDGAGAIAALGQNSDLSAQVSAWFEKHLDGWSISLDYAGSVYRCILRRGEIGVNLADAGHGIQQVLPVVVQQLSHQTESGYSLLDLAEQPELHLHAAAHAPLGDLFLDTARLGKTQVVVETHSENLLLRVRRRIAEGLNPALVALYFVQEQADGGSIVKPIEILPDGSVDWWPKGIFTEGYEEAKALDRARRRSAERNKA